MGNSNEPTGHAPPADLPNRVLDHLLEGCQVISTDYRYLYVNESAVRHAKVTREELLGRAMTECYPGIETTAMFAQLRTCMEQRAEATIENEFEFPDGSKGWFELRFEPVAEGVAILSLDITDRKRAEAALRRTLRALTILGNCNQILVHATDEQQFVQEICELVVESGGYRAAWIGLDASSARHPHNKRTQVGAGDHQSATASANPTLAFELRYGGAAIGTLTVRADEPDAFDSDECALLQEIALDLGHGIETLRARIVHASTEAQLVMAQRLEAVGRLAGGVAHDFNNLLSVILTYAGFAADRLSKSDPIREDIEQVREAGMRASTLTRQLLAFSRKQIMEPRVTALNQVLSGIDSMLHRLLGEDIDIEVRPAPDLGNVMADPGQLEQVVMNLAVNARDAMPDGGRLTIETDNVDLEEDYAEDHFSVRPGRYVRMSVSDTGTGMSEETRDRIFEPFFTTKEMGKGTGLGLSMVYGIIKQSGGNIWVYSELGQGTTFKIYLPRVDAAAEERKPMRPTELMTGDELILLVEDEPLVRKAATRILKAAGYNILSAANGHEALLLGEEHHESIDLLLTDVIMPEMSGPDLAQRLAKINPGIKVLFTSGYTDTAIVRHGALDASTRFIGKPFSATDLTVKVREVLDEQE